MITAPRKTESSRGTAEKVQAVVDQSEVDSPVSPKHLKAISFERFELLIDLQMAVKRLGLESHGFRADLEAITKLEWIADTDMQHALLLAKTISRWRAYDVQVSRSEYKRVLKQLRTLRKKMNHVSTKEPRA